MAEIIFENPLKTTANAAPTWDLVGNVRDLTLNLETGEADVSTRGNNGWRATVGTLKDASLEFEMVWDTADSDFGAVRDAFLNNSTVEFAVMDGLITGAGSSGSQQRDCDVRSQARVDLETTLASILSDPLLRAVLDPEQRSRATVLPTADRIQHPVLDAQFPRAGAGGQGDSPR